MEVKSMRATLRDAWGFEQELLARYILFVVLCPSWGLFHVIFRCY